MLSKQFISFSVIGGIGFFVDTGVLYILAYSYDVSLYLGRLVSYLTAVTVTFLLNGYFTFENEFSRSGVGLVSQWLKFASCNVLGALVNYSIYALLIGFSSWFYQYPVLAVAIGTLFSVNINFLLSRRYVF